MSDIQLTKEESSLLAELYESKVWSVLQKHWRIEELTLLRALTVRSQDLDTIEFRQGEHAGFQRAISRAYGVMSQATGMTEEWTAADEKFYASTLGFPHVGE